nr:hypothetical protein GCM10020093_060930 [Planobispora longispora]
MDNRFTTYRPEEPVRLAPSKPARFEPGTDWSCSNTNHVLARLLIEHDLSMFISALLGGELLPAELLAEMCTPHPKAGYGLGLFVQEAPGGATVITHNGGAAATRR